MTKKQKILKQFILPLFVQIALTGVLLVMHMNTIGRGPMIAPISTIGEDASSPTLGRALYAAFAFSMCVILTHMATLKQRKEKYTVAFYLGFTAGTFLWQGIGEDFWHFGFYDEGSFINFVQLESAQSLPVFATFTILLVYCVINQSIDYGFTTTILSFVLNWGGHFLLIGTYPIVQDFVERGTWYRTFGVVTSLIALILALYFGLKDEISVKTRLLLSMLFYFSVGNLFFSFIDS